MVNSFWKRTFKEKNSSLNNLKLND